jgi:bifunctional UDP-N-acetylglucosamine pyrophosphorylase/glucosamine-1-phosphate N-acetyltransferase
MASSTGFASIVLAAGQGTRMKSALPKILHPLAGRPMIAYPVQAALDAGAERVVVVVGHGRAEVEAELAARFDARVQIAVQPEQRGTGDAARCGAEPLADYRGVFLIHYGDCPLITPAALQALHAASCAADGPLALLTATVADATGYGRILRDGAGRVTGIREHKDCSDAERAIREFNPGVYAIRAPFFRRAVAELATDNAQGELYLTDLVAMGARGGGVADVAWNAAELEGINDRLDLAARERDLRLRIAHALARSGVTLREPDSAFIDADVVVEPDATLEPNVHLRGRTRIGAGARIDTGCVLTDVEVAAGAQLLPYTVASQSRIGEGARVGPFSHLRPDSELGPDTHVGNFVELKKTTFGRGSKANHLAYLGDGVVGEGVNVGAGTIFCNYDGFGKYVTVLEDGVFIGSDSQLIAPVTVGKDAYVATGSTVTQDVPADSLAIGRARQVNKDKLAPRLKEKLRAQAAKAKKAREGE